MLFDAKNLHNFYDTRLGATTKRVIGRHIREAWPEVKGMNVLGIGFSHPYLNTFRKEANRVISAIPISEGTYDRHGYTTNDTYITSETELSLPDLSMDRILIIHALERIEAIRPMMREVWRVLSGSGRLLVITPNRRGIWARLERTPFGYGQPYSHNQLSKLLIDTMFTPITSSGVLYVPPSNSSLLLSSAWAWENIGKFWFSAVGGVVSVEACKQIYAGTPLRERQHRRVYSTILNQ